MWYGTNLLSKFDIFIVKNKDENSWTLVHICSILPSSNSTAIHSSCQATRCVSDRSKYKNEKKKKINYHFEFLFHFPRDVYRSFVYPLDGEHASLINTDLSENGGISKVGVRIRTQRHLAGPY